MNIVHGVAQEPCRCGSEGHGLVGNSGGRLTIGLGNLRGLFQP